MVLEIALRILMILALIFTKSMISAQTLDEYNVIRNGDFEQTTKCPGGFTKPYHAMTGLLNWFQPTFGTCDYFNECSKKHDSGVPRNYFGEQEALSGNGYVGFGADRTGYREYFAQELDTSLVSGNTYYITFYLSRADRMPYAMDSIGCGLTSRSPMQKTNDAIGVDTMFLVQDSALNTSDWVECRYTYQALGNERYIIIGAFSRTRVTFVRNRKIPRGAANMAYYYVDCVSIIAK